MVRPVQCGFWKNSFSIVKRILQLKFSKLSTSLKSSYRDYGGLKSKVTLKKHQQTSKKISNQALFNTFKQIFFEKWLYFFCFPTSAFSFLGIIDKTMPKSLIESKKPLKELKYMFFWIEVVKFDSLFFGVFWCFFKVTFDFKPPYLDNYFSKI